LTSEINGCAVKRNIVLFLVLIVVITAMLVFGRKRNSHSANAAAGGKIVEGSFKGKAAPDFALQTLDGQTLKLSDLRGKAVVLNFWATWCTPCKAEMPWFVDFQKQYGGQGLQIVGVAMDDSAKEDIDKFAKQMGVNYPVVLGKESLADQYGGVEFLPTTFYIDRSGNIQDRVFGIVDRQEAEASVKKALASAASAPANTVPTEAPNQPTQNQPTQGVRP
jgi:cytochrome c biogenesis protein CcmG/thiol:disulfide interchange protein DsbE